MRDRVGPRGHDGPEAVHPAHVVDAVRPESVLATPIASRDLQPSSAKRRVHLREPRLELGRPNEVGSLQIATEPPLVEPQHELAPGSLVERVAFGTRAELGAQRDELLVLGRPETRSSRKRRCSASSKWSGVSAASSSSEGRVADDRREQVALALEARLEQPRRRAVRPRADAARERAGASPASVSRGRSSRSASRRSASCRSGESSAVGEDLPRANERLLPVVGALEHDPHAVVEVALRVPEPRGERVRRVGRVLALRQRDDTDVEPLPDGELHPAERRLLSGCIGVEAEEEPLRETAELTQLMLRERRAHRRDDGLDAGLPESDHVGVALDDDRAVLLGDRGPREVEAVEDVPLLEQLALGCVDVLAACSGSSSRSRRAWKPTIRPRASASGNMSRNGK